MEYVLEKRTRTKGILKLNEKIKRNGKKRRNEKREFRLSLNEMDRSEMEGKITNEIDYEERMEIRFISYV